MKQTTPKPTCMVDGEPWWDFAFEYEFAGKTWIFSVRARSAHEARERMKKIALARYIGQIDGNAIPAPYGRWWAPLVVWWRNRWREMRPR